MDERSQVLLITKIVLLLLLILFPQWQQQQQQGSSHFKFLCSAQRSRYNNGKRGASGSVNNESGPLLPDAEVNSVNRFMSGLNSREDKITRNSCQNGTINNQFLNISCSLVNGTERHISEIITKDEDLTGKILKDVADLTYLRKLDLSDSKIHGSIPYQIGYLFNLVYLDLSQNQLTGTIPSSLGNLTKLEVLDLGRNLLTGKIPRSLGSLSSLNYLCARSNMLSGKIPPELGNLSQLEILYLEENRLSGPLTPELGKLTNLNDFWLASNYLSGPMPKDFENLSNLESFDIAGNSLSGAIPKFIAEWVNLYDLDLMGNNFQGELPPEIFNISSLQYLCVSDLQTKEFGLPESDNNYKLGNLSALVLRNCSITGEIPSYIARRSSQLKFLDLSFNNLTGGVPDNFKNLSLDGLLLTRNRLNGTLPDWIYHIVNETGDLAYNEFSKFPEPKMHKNGANKNSQINLEPKNRTFPEEIMKKHCPGSEKYKSLYINAGGKAENVGEIPYEADNSTSNFYVNEAKYNWAYSCNGYFFVSELTNISSGFIQKAACGASVTDAPLYAKARLCPISLKYYGFCLYNGEYNVTLHFSEIVFAKDDDHTSSGKRVFDIYIQKELRYSDFNIKEIAGSENVTHRNFNVTVQSHLLEIELLWAGKGSLYYPAYLHGPLISAISVDRITKERRGLSKIAIVGVVLGAAALVLLFLLALMWRIGWLGDRELRVTKVNLRGKSYTIKQVKDATRNFSPRNEIGKGRFGTVYKAELSDQTVVVKKLSPQSKQVIDQIGTEVYALKALKHDNIVELLECYSKKDLHLLIYEYMEKGSLDRVLFEATSTTRLNWPARVGICLGIAKGLKYLHEDNPSRKIIHRDIKPKNIMLDGNLNAKLSDLGLAKIYDEDNPYQFILEKGATVVYMAPEYAMRRAITEKVDVYSFGLVLLEIVSGQTNAKYEPNQETVFLLDKAIVSSTKGRLFELIDKVLQVDREVKKQAVEILELAMKCVDQSPTLRPTMSEVVTVLDSISGVDAHSA